MLVSLVLALAALRSGLSLRRARLTRRPQPPGARARHLRVAKVAVLMIVVGFAAGPLSTHFLRGWTAFSTFHGVAGGTAGVLFVATALRGRVLERGPSDAAARDLHALLALLSVLAGAVAAFAGFVLLP